MRRLTIIYTLTAMLLVATAQQAYAQAVAAVINGPKQAEVGDLIILDAGRSTGTQFKWLLLNSKKAFLPVENGTKVVFASGQPAEYIFVLVVGGVDSNQRIDVAIAEHRLTIGRPPPVVDVVDPDKPDPPPDPQPDPAKTGPRWVLIIDETETTTPEAAGLYVALRKAETAQYLKSKNHKLRILDPDTTDQTDKALMAGWLKQLEATPTRPKIDLPAILIVDPAKATAAGGGVLHAARCPPSPQAIIELLKAHGG